MKEKFQRAQTFWPVFFLSTLPILCIVRSRLLIAREVQFSNFGIWFISPFEDIFIIGIFSILFFLFLRPVWALIVSFILVLLNMISVLFYVKMEHPLTPDLLGQTGDIFALRTSIFDQSNGRLFMLFGGLLTIYAMMIFLSYLLKNKFRKYFKPLLILFLGAGVGVLFVGEKHRVYTYNSMLRTLLGVAMSKTPANKDEVKQILGFSPDEIGEGQSEPQSGLPKRNIILVILETASFNLGQDQKKFSEVMPFFSSLIESPHSTSYNQHYAPWPFSSKSLYATTCGSSSLLTSVIEFRIFPEKKCNSWLEQLGKNGFKTGVFYSGDLKYDNMGKFFMAQGANFFWDSLKAQADKYESNAWGIDDKATYDAVAEWSQLQQPFAAMAILLNSHYPYWVAAKGNLQKFEDPYLNAFSYQDQLLESFFDKLDKSGILDNSVVIITGDHGRQFGQNIRVGELNRSTFHVPLVIYDKKNKGPGKTISFPTSHIDLKGAILELANVKGSYLKDHNLRISKPVFSYYKSFELLVQVVSNEEGVVLYNVDKGNYRFAKTWGEELKEQCAFLDCQNSKKWLADFYWMALTAGQN